MFRFFLFLLFLLPTTINVQAQEFAIKGLAVEAIGGKPIANMSIENIYNRTGTITDSAGSWALPVKRGELLEFRKLGYKTTRVRIPPGDVPPYFRILVEKGAFELDEVTIKDRFRSYQADSARYAETFKAPLNVGRMSGAQTFNDPFTALSKSRRQAWAFQEEYEKWEKIRYVDYTFSDRTVELITGLKGDSLQGYRRQFRPPYEALRSWKEYELFRYIKTTAAIFRGQ